MDKIKKKELVVLEQCELENGSYTSICFDAMKNLSENWYLVAADDNDDDKPVLERNYVLSLVFQMGKNTNYEEQKVKYADLNSGFGTNVFPSGENIKDLDYKHEETKDTYQKLYKREYPSSQVVIPDLVIHTSHDPRAAKSDGQHVAVEVKTTKKLDRTPFFKDFFKLNRYICDLRFKNAIYLIVNTPKKRIEDLIKQYFKKKLFFKKNKLGKLLFFIQEGQNSSPIVWKLTTDYINSI